MGPLFWQALPELAFCFYKFLSTLLMFGGFLRGRGYYFGELFRSCNFGRLSRSSLLVFFSSYRDCFGFAIFCGGALYASGVFLSLIEIALIFSFFWEGEAPAEPFEEYRFDGLSFC